MMGTVVLSIISLIFLGVLYINREGHLKYLSFFLLIASLLILLITILVVSKVIRGVFRQNSEILMSLIHFIDKEEDLNNLIDELSRRSNEVVKEVMFHISAKKREIIRRHLIKSLAIYERWLTLYPAPDGITSEPPEEEAWLNTFKKTAEIRRQLKIIRSS